MPLFVIIGHDVANSAALRAKTRDAHLARLHKLEDEGRLIIAGPTPIETSDNSKAPIQMSGSVIIAAFEDFQAVQRWANDEPYLKAGIYSHVEIKPFIKAIPETNS